MKRRLGQLIGRNQPGGLTLVFKDTFTAPDGTLLENHTPDVNGLSAAWVVDNNISTNTGKAEIQNNVATNTAVIGSANSQLSLDCEAASRTVKFRVRPTDSFIVVCPNATSLDRYNGGTISTIELGIFPGNGDIVLRTNESWTFNTLHTFAMTANANVWYACEAVIDGSACEVTITKESTGETETAFVDPAIASGNLFIFELDNTDGNSPGVDDVEVYH